MEQKIKVVSRLSSPKTEHQIKLIFCEYWKDVPEGDLSGAEVYFVKSDAADCPEAPPAFKEALTRLDSSRQEVTQLRECIEQVIDKLYDTEASIVARERLRYDNEIRIKAVMHGFGALQKRFDHHPQKKRRLVDSCPQCV